MANKTININTIESEVMTVLYKSLDSMNFNKSGIDKDYPKRTISHNQLNYCFRMIHKNVFKPESNMINNQDSIINYSDIKQLKIIADLFINICDLFNKSLGLMSFSYMTGIEYTTIYRWNSEEGKKSNPERWQLLQNIKEYHKAAQIGLLNESPVGSLAVANNDTETGLEWSSKQALNVPQNAVFLIPSERVKRLQITDGSKTE